MYVSSYSSYIPNISSSKTDTRDKKEQESDHSRSKFTIHQQTKSPLAEKNLTIDQNYQSKYNFFRDSSANKDLDHLKKIKNYNDAKTAYSDNSKLFALSYKPKAVIGNVTLVDRNLPKEAQETKEKIQKQKLINIYVENDNYYRVTAA